MKIHQMENQLAKNNSTLTRFCHKKNENINNWLAQYGIEMILGTLLNDA